MTDHNDPPTTTDETFRAIERVIDDLHRGGVLTVRPDEDDTPVRGELVSINLRRNSYGEWTVSVSTDEGRTSGNFGPRPGNMLAGLFDYLRECNAGDWTAFNRATGRAI